MNGSVLVHCANGISRSPTIVTAYIIHKLKLSADNALKYVNERRKINPNKGFL